ncbi:MAG TPA: TlpA disulfide reductase family protein [Kofleriaceae bacterium]|nr:TlpA disulfide reductase family protein [Kofleriaceae bacterium]
MAETPRSGILVDPRSLIVGGLVAAVGVVVLVFFMWMVPNAAAREAKSACAGLMSQPPLNPALCPSGAACTYPIAAPDFVAYDHNNQPVKLSQFRGKVVLLNFWASWCGVCKTEKPHLEQMAKDMAGNDFVVIALASDRNWSDVLVAIVDALAPNVPVPGGKDVSLSDALHAYALGLPKGTAFQVLLDPPKGDNNIGQIAASWGITAVPESALIDRQGNIRHYFGNKRDWNTPVAETCLRSVIDE